MNETPRSVLIGAGGTGAAFAAVMSLRRHWDSNVRVVVMDTNPARLVAASVLADACETIPPFSDPRAAEAVCAAVARHSISTYLPVFDSEVVLAARLREEGRLPADVRVLAPPATSARICEDKLLTYRWLTEQGIATPFTSHLAAGVSPGEWFLKRRVGYGSRGARRIVFGGFDELPPVEPQEWVVQEVCCGPEVTLDVFFSLPDGRTYVVCRERLEVKAGVCVKARLFHDTKLAALAAKVAQGLKLDGVSCMQVMRRDGDWVVTDINPRPGGGTAMSAPLGIDLLAAAFAHTWGEDPWCFLPTLDGETFVVRQWVDLVTARKPC